MVRNSTRNLASTITAVLAIILVFLSLPLMYTTMGTEASNCGTIWASEDTWKYSSTYDGPEGYFNSRTSPKASVAAAVDDLMADWSRGASAFEDCKNKHHDRMTILLILGGTAFILVAFSIGLRIRRTARRRPPANNIS